MCLCGHVLSSCSIDAKRKLHKVSLRKSDLKIEVNKKYGEISERPSFFRVCFFFFFWNFDQWRRQTMEMAAICKLSATGATAAILIFPRTIFIIASLFAYANIHIMYGCIYVCGECTLSLSNSTQIYVCVCIHMYVCTYKFNFKKLMLIHLCKFILIFNVYIAKCINKYLDICMYMYVVAYGYVELSPAENLHNYGIKIIFVHIAVLFSG